MAIVGSDNENLEVVPFEENAGVFEVHQILLAQNGIYIIENLNLEEMARDRAWETFFVLGAPRITGGVQAMVNPIAKVTTMKKLVFLMLLILSSAFFAYGQSKVESLDKYVEAARQEWRVPGLSIVVVQDGKVLLSKGYGVRELGKDAKVDTETLFGCMSTTKAMTAVAMGMLVDEGKVNWDDKVTKYLPYFRVDDRYVTGDLRFSDLLTHNTGVGNADSPLGLDPKLSSDEVVRRMQYAKQAYPLRGGFIYQSTMYRRRSGDRKSQRDKIGKVHKRAYFPRGNEEYVPQLRISKKYQNRRPPILRSRDRSRRFPRTRQYDRTGRAVLSTRTISVNG